MVDMQIQAAIGAQYAMHLDQPYRHETEESAHILPVGMVRRVDDFIHRAPVIEQGIHPIGMNVLIPGPFIAEFTLLIMEISLFLKWWISSDEVHGFAIHPAQEVQVIAVIERAVLEVRFCHFSNSDFLLNPPPADAQLAPSPRSTAKTSSRGTSQTISGCPIPRSSTKRERPPTHFLSVAIAA